MTSGKGANGAHQAAMHALSHVSNASRWERAAPFLAAILLVLLSVLAAHIVVKQLATHFSTAYDDKELKKIDNRRAPNTHAQAAYWAVDAAQIPIGIGAPLATVILLRKVYNSDFVVVYLVALVIGLGFCVYFLYQVNIERYGGRGFTPFKFRITPVTIMVLILNIVGAIVAAYVVG